MTTIYDVPAELLIKRTAKDLKQNQECAPPEWAPFVKTAVHKEKAPADPEWWHVRQAAILRKIYIQGPIGIERLRTLFSGPKNRGSKPNKTMPSSGSIVGMPSSGAARASCPSGPRQSRICPMPNTRASSIHSRWIRFRRSTRTRTSSTMGLTPP